MEESKYCKKNENARARQKETREVAKSMAGTVEWSLCAFGFRVCVAWKAREQGMSDAPMHAR